jgi:transposase
VRLEGWVTLGSQWNSLRTDDFIEWSRARLVPRLRAGDIVSSKPRGATVKFLPPYSPDLNPIEAVRALVKKHIRAFAPRTASALRRIARAAHAIP